MEKKKEFGKTALTMATLALVFLLASTILLVAMPTADALDYPTYALLTANPNPVGVNQIVYINGFMSKPTPTAGMGGTGDMYEQITIKITRPDGTTETIGPLRSDPTGGTWYEYRPTQIGIYSLQMFYPGQTIVTGTQAGNKLLPSTSSVITFTVQQNPIEAQYNSPPLPTEYWSRPIYSLNYEWAKLGGSWYGLRAPSFATTGMYDAVGNVQLYTTAPNTGHIVWTKPTHFGGQPGEPISADQSSQYTSTSILINHFEPIILNGILYYTQRVGVSSTRVSWEAVDLRTGELVWSRSAGEQGTEILRMGQIMRFHTMQEFGSVAYLYSAPLSNVMSLYDAKTGVFVANFTDGVQNVPFLIDFTGQQMGTLLGYYTSGGNLTLWNSTLAMSRGSINPVTIRPSGNINWSYGVQWTVPVVNQLGGQSISLSIAARTPEVILMRQAPTLASQIVTGYQITAGYDARTGALLWGPLNQTLPTMQDVALLTAAYGVYVLHNKDTNEAYGYSMSNGQRLWGPVKLQGNAWSHISRAAEIAYGMVYIWDFGGYVHALDLQTGAIKWTFTRGTAGYDSPYGIYPLWHFGTHSICDGKIFLSEGSMYNPPVHPSKRLAIDAFTGELVWSILSYSGRITGAHADGYMVQWNSFDAQIYTFGKGPTATAVTASPKISTDGNSVLIEGRVTDESPGTKHSDRIARFPNGVPAIADECMSPWMEYVYMQQPKPTDATGVLVYLTATDPNNNTQDIGTVTTDADGNFAVLWAPPVPGIYTIKASFDGSESYYGSYGKASFGVLEAPAASPSPAPTVMPTTAPTVLPTSTPTVSPSVVPQPEAAPGTEMYIIAVAATVIMAVVATAAFTLRRRK